MKLIISSVAVLVAAVLPMGAAAQSNGTMGKGDKMNKMEMKDTTGQRRDFSAAVPSVDGSSITSWTMRNGC